MFAVNEWKTYFKIAAAAFVLFLAVHYWPSFARVVGAAFAAAVPLLLGCAIAYIVNILMSFYERHFFPETGKAGCGKAPARCVCWGLF